MKKLIILIVLFFSMNNIAQETLQTNFFKITLPYSTSFKKEKVLNEETSQLVFFQIFNTKGTRLKYLLYLMANRLESNINSVSEYHFKEYLKDIGGYNLIKASTLTFNSRKYYKLKLKLDKGPLSIVYVYNINNVLYRMLFMFPNEEQVSKYSNEIDEMFESAIFLKNTW